MSISFQTNSFTMNPYPPLPTETARSAQMVFGKGNLYLVIGDHLHEILAGLDAPGFWKPQIFSAHAQKHPIILALITAFQIEEKLTDRQMVEALRTRGDLKYALHLPLNSAVCSAPALSEYRKHLLWQETNLLALVHLYERLISLNFLPARPIDPESVLQSLRGVCTACRLELMADAMCLALEYLAASQAEWLRRHAQAHWYIRYRRPGIDSYFLAAMDDIQPVMQSVGQDAEYLLDKLSFILPPEFEGAPDIQNLQTVFTNQYQRLGGAWCWNKEGCNDCTMNHKR